VQYPRYATATDGTDDGSSKEPVPDSVGAHSEELEADVVACALQHLGPRADVVDAREERRAFLLARIQVQVIFIG
jgi:hypothetical protein